MESIIDSGDTTRIQSALRIVFHSDDPNMRSLGIRAYVASLKELTFDAQLPPQVQRQYDDAQGETEKLKDIFSRYPYVQILAGSALRIHVVFSKYEITNGAGVAASGAQPGSFTISGDRVSVTTNISFASAGNFNCNFDFRPSAEMIFRGTLACGSINQYVFPKISISAPIF
jgi:hypothetical protein